MNTSDAHGRIFSPMKVPAFAGSKCNKVSLASCFWGRVKQQASYGELVTKFNPGVQRIQLGRVLAPVLAVYAACSYTHLTLPTVLLRLCRYSLALV